MSNIVERINQYILHKGISVRQFELSLEASNGLISKAIKNSTDIQSKWIEKIFYAYRDLNPLWLLSGEGQMIVINKQSLIDTPKSKLLDEMHNNLVKKGILKEVDLLEFEKNYTEETNENLWGYNVGLDVGVTPKKGLETLHFSEQEENAMQVNEPASTDSVKGVKIPFVEVLAVAGWGNSDFSISNQDVKDFYVVPKFKDRIIDFMIEVHGSSMYPKYNSGDVVACRKINENGFIQWNKVHLIATKDQGILIKRIKKSDNPEYILAVSDNKDYEPFLIPREEIEGIALVVGVIRLE